MTASSNTVPFQNLRVSELERRASKLTVSVLPDFFFDRIVSVPSLERLFHQAKLKAAAGGGNLRGYSQIEIRGGNAANLATALAALSAKVRLYCIGDDRVRGMLAELPDNCELHLIPGRPGFTVALEFPFPRRTVNVMVSDVGDLSTFDGRSLTQSHLVGLRDSNLIALLNWSASVRGNELARTVFSLKRRKRRLNFLDPADLAGAEKRIPILVKMMTREHLIDVLSLNENEVRILAESLSLRKPRRSYAANDILEAATKLHDELQTTIDIHTPIGSASACDDELAWEQAPGQLRGFVTGAGDVWDAGDIVGHLLGLTVAERLRFANLGAYLYLRSGRTRLPSVRQVVRFASHWRGFRHRT